MKVPEFSLEDNCADNESERKSLWDRNLSKYLIPSQWRTKPKQFIDYLCVIIAMKMLEKDENNCSQSCKMGVEKFLGYSWHCLLYKIKIIYICDIRL